MSASRDFGLAKTTALAEAILAGRRRELARAITMIESTRQDHRMIAEALMDRLLPHSGRSFRLGISGVPGVGKSTFIEALGLHIIERGHRVAVLTVDPSSPKSGGSILGDKTRMETLSRHKDAFIRPSPSGGTLGGVARRTHEVMVASEAAGFDVVLVETVGVGQSETAVVNLTDMFLLLIAPGGGDDLQGIKKGVVEMADLIAVNKADGDLLAAAERAQQDYSSALQLLRQQPDAWQPRVMACSAMEGTGVAALWDAVLEFQNLREESGQLIERREEQAAAWMWGEISEALLDGVRNHAATQSLALKLERDVRAGKLGANAAAKHILQQFLSNSAKP
ncbi:MAG: methylmalonyl Co-A mutase-associated GTPase MeaB [Magnetovibrio sp.]|nr:methylmalonyl Co-A mutase-associated GTPase MeaB [Magnetovibrio sp.]